MRSAAKFVWIIVFISFVGGFLLLETSGLLGANAITPSTKVATVNGEDILYAEWAQRLEELSRQQSEQIGRALTLDELKALEEQILDEMTIDILLAQEYRRRGISVTDDEIIGAAERFPHPALLEHPDLQTDGVFDREKYRRYLASPNTRESGTLSFLEQYYRSEIPRRKLFDQLVADVFVSEAELWRRWQELRDSVQVSFVALNPDVEGDTISVDVSDSEIRAHYETNKNLYEQAGRALVTVVQLPRTITAGDTAAARERAVALREEIAAGDDSAFVEVARRESDDQRTAQAGGVLRPGVAGQFFGPSFDSAAFALSKGQLSQPILSPLGYHVVHVDDRKGDTLHLRHVLVEIRQNDSTAVSLARRADSLTSIAAGSLDPAKFDLAVSLLGLDPQDALVFEGQPLSIAGDYIPSVSAWAFSGAVPGETSDIFDSADGYFMARLDSVSLGGVQPLDEVRDDIRSSIARRKKVERLIPRAEQIAAAAVAGSLDSAASAAGLQVLATPPFARTTFVPGLGQNTKAVGAAFALPVGAISAPVATEDAVFILRIDRKVNADREEWAAQLASQRALVTQTLQQERVQGFMRALRDRAKVEDHRDALNQLGRADS